MSEQQIILDDKSFKALSADSRVNILKSLKERRMTLTELGKRLSLESSTVKEHCTVLMNADLIKVIDDGHKWKYYELTGKGKNIIMPQLFEQVRVLIVLCLGAVIFSGIFFGLLSTFGSISNIGSAAPQAYDTAIMKKNIPLEATDAPLLATSAAPAQETRAIATTQEITREFFILTTTFALLAGIIIGWIGARKA